MTKRVCAEVGCPLLVDAKAGRCEDHRRAKEKARGTRQERGYDRDYQAQLQAPEYVNATHCANCGRPFTVDNPKTGGHSVAIRDGGKGSRVVPHCADCNYGWRRSGL